MAEEKHLDGGNGLVEDDHIRVLGPVEAVVVGTRKLSKKEQNLTAEAEAAAEEEDIDQYVLVIEIPVDNEGVVYSRLEL